MNIAPYTSMVTKARRQDIDRQAEKDRLARSVRENDSKKNIFVTIKNTVISLFSRRKENQQSASWESVEEYSKENRANRELQA